MPDCFTSASKPSQKTELQRGALTYDDLFEVFGQLLSSCKQLDNSTARGADVVWADVGFPQVEVLSSRGALL